LALILPTAAPAFKFAEEAQMNLPKQILDPNRSDSGYGKLVLIGLCIAFLTAAVAKQLPARPLLRGAPVIKGVTGRYADMGRWTARDERGEYEISPTGVTR
jgi:hypothetical protein